MPSDHNPCELCIRKRFVLPPSVLLVLVNPACAPLATLGFFYFPLLVHFGHVPEHNQTVLESCRWPYFPLIIKEIMPQPALRALGLPARHINTERAYFAQFADPDATYLSLCFCLLRATVYFCQYGVPVPASAPVPVPVPWLPGKSIC